MYYLHDFIKEFIATGILLFLVILSRVIVIKLVRSFAKRSQTLEKRTRLVIKYIHLLVNMIAVIAIIIIWGVQTKDIFIAFSSIATVVGVAMFAQWSILSNITSGISYSFLFPIKLGITFSSTIKISPLQPKLRILEPFTYI